MGSSSASRWRRAGWLRCVLLGASCSLSGCATPALWAWALSPPETHDVVEVLEVQPLNRVSCRRIDRERAELQVEHVGGVEPVELGVRDAQGIASFLAVVSGTEWRVTVSDGGLLAHTTVEVTGSLPLGARPLGVRGSERVPVTAPIESEHALFERFAWGVWASGPSAERPAVPVGWIERAPNATWGPPVSRARVDAAWASADAGGGTDEIEQLEFVMSIDGEEWWAISGAALWIAARADSRFADERLYVAYRLEGRASGAVRGDDSPGWFDVAASGRFERRSRRSAAMIPKSARVVLAVLATPAAILLDLVGMWMETELDPGDEPRRRGPGC